MGITDKISHAAERKAFETIPDGKWAHYTQRLIRENDPYILKTFLTNAAYEGGFRGYQTAQENAAKYDINVPWLILMDPTSACNTHCTGCWAAEYGHKQSLSICYTSRNYKVVTSDEFLDLLIDKGCVFAWYFHYMPAGLNADTSLLLTPEQRTYMKNWVREIRGVTGGKELYCIASISATLYGVMEAFSFTPMPSCRRARIFSVTRPNMGRPHRRS